VRTRHARYKQQRWQEIASMDMSIATADPSAEMDIVARKRARFEARKHEEMSLSEYLERARADRMVYATAAERMLAAIGEPAMLDTRKDPRLSRIFSNRVVPIYPAFREFYGMEDVIEQIVAYFRHAAQGLEERKQILYLLGPVGGGKSSIAERLKALMESYPIYALKGSPVNESPLGLFSVEEDGDALEAQYGIPRRYLSQIASPRATKRLE
jgi:serine protein kinase